MPRCNAKEIMDQRVIVRVAVKQRKRKEPGGLKGVDSKRALEKYNVRSLTLTDHVCTISG